MSTARPAASPQGGLVELVGRQISDVLQLDACRFDHAPTSRRDRPRLLPDGTITWRGHPVDVEHDGPPTLDEIELPVTAQVRAALAVAGIRARAAAWPAPAARSRGSWCRSCPS